MSIQVGLEDDLSAMLLDNDVDPEVPEGTEYYLPAGSSYCVLVLFDEGFPFGGQSWRC